MKIAQDNKTRALGKYKFYYDKKTKHKHFEVGDKVLLLQSNKQNLLQTQWNGPYIICEKIHLNNHRVRVKDKTRTYHANLLNIFIEREEEEPTFAKSFIDYEGKQEDPSHEEIIDELEISPNQEKTAYGINEELNGEKREELQQIIRKHDKIFSDKPGSAKIDSHTIPLKSNVRIVSRPYKVPFNQRSELSKELMEVEKLGIMRRSNSPYGSPIIVIVQRKIILSEYAPITEN